MKNNDKNPSPYLFKALKESAADVKAGRVYSFDAPNKVLAFIDDVIEKSRSPKSKSSELYS